MRRRGVATSELSFHRVGTHRRVRIEDVSGPDAVRQPPTFLPSLTLLAVAWAG